VQGLLDRGDTFLAIEHVLGLGDDRVVAVRFFQLAGDLYGKAKNVKAMVAVGRAGVQHCLAASRRLRAEDPKKARVYRSLAQQMSYNLAANTWPGWDDKGIVIDRSDMRFGLDMARLDLRLATELKYPAIKISNGHWMVGAQEMALGRYDGAKASFEKARAKAAEAGEADHEWMCKGYGALAAMLAGDESASDRFDAAVKALKAMGKDDATFFASQLETALVVFTRKKKAK